MSPAVKALLVQSAASLFWLTLAAPALAWQGIPLSPLRHALACGVVAALLGQAWNMPRWWLGINLAFLPAVALMQRASLASHWYLAGFGILLLVYWGVARTRVPLYLSSRAAWRAVSPLLPPNALFADLGSGLGGLNAYLSQRRRDCRFVGIEAAPLPFLYNRLRACASRGRHEVRWGSFWRADLRPFDVVYAYLSPVPMADLWAKACAEMRPGTLFISNTFAVPGVIPSATVELDDLHRSTLHLYRIGAVEETGP